MPIVFWVVLALWVIFTVVGRWSTPPLEKMVWLADLALLVVLVALGLQSFHLSLGGTPTP